MRLNLITKLDFELVMAMVYICRLNSFKKDSGFWMHSPSKINFIYKSKDCTTFYIGSIQKCGDCIRISNEFHFENEPKAPDEINKATENFYGWLRENENKDL